MSESDPPAPSVNEPLPDVVGAAAVVIFCLVGVISAIIEVLLIPFYVGGRIFPITVLITIVLNIALPILVRMTVEWNWAIALPVVAWVVTIITLGYANTGHGSVLVPGYGDGEWVGLAVFFVGTLAGFVSVIRERALRAVSARR